MGHSLTAATRGRQERFAAQLRDYRQRHKLTIPQLARQLGYSVWTVRSWLSYAMPRKSVYNRLIRELGLRRGYIEGYEITTSSPRPIGTFSDYLATYRHIAQHNHEDLPIFLAGVGLKLYQRLGDADLWGKYTISPEGLVISFDFHLTGVVQLRLTGDLEAACYNLAVITPHPRLELREDVESGALSEENVRSIIRHLDKFKQIGQSIRSPAEWKPDMAQQAEDFLGRRG